MQSERLNGTRKLTTTTFKYLLAVILSVFLYNVNSTAQQTSSDHRVSVDKGDIPTFIGDKESKGERKIYKGEELKTIGMPIGGICAGQLYVRGDGTLANWWIANNAYNTGYGIDWLMNFNTSLGPWKVCYQTFEPQSYIDQGFKITVDDGIEQQVKSLSKEGFDDISFIGEYPIAYVSYRQKDEDFPIDIDAEFFSPFIPLDAKKSATPGTIIKYKVQNNSNKTLSVALEGWMQNLVCIDLRNRINGVLQNRVISGDGMKSVYMDLRLDGEDRDYKTPIVKHTVFEDFESGTYDKWKIEGQAFGQSPSKGELCNQNKFIGDYGDFLANSYTDFDKLKGKLISNKFKIKSSYISFMIAGGYHPHSTCINLVVDDQIVKSQTGNNNEEFQVCNWDVKEYKGKFAHFEIVDNEIGDWGHISIDNIFFANQPMPEPLKQIDETHAYYGNLCLSVFDEDAKGTADMNEDQVEYAETKIGNKLNGALSSSVILQPQEEKEITFVLSWYFPNRPLSYKGSEWNKPIPPNSPAIGNMYANWYNSSLDVANQLYENYETLSQLTHEFHDAYYLNTTIPYWLMQRSLMSISTLATETCQWWSNDKFWAWEGVGSCEGTCTHVWGYAQAMAAIFPELERNLREKTDYSVSLQDDGGILSRNGEFGVLIDGHASVILRMYREHLMSKNNYFLSRNWDKIKRSIQYLINEDENEDGLIEKTQANTYDIAFNGANTFVGSLYLAALRAGEKMAIVMRDTSAANYYKRIYTKGCDNTMRRLWNGNYFFQDVDENKYPKNQYGKGCLSDQLFGQSWASLYHLGNIYPTQAIDTALMSIWRYNWARDVKKQNELHKPERYFAHDGEPGLFVCTWPFSKHPGENGVRYRDEVWTGIEYEVASLLINRNFIDEGLAIVRGVHERYNGEKHNPWNEVECGDHYARAMASYGVLQAIQGYFYNGPEGIIDFNPKIEKNGITGFFTSAEGWGNIAQYRSDNTQTNVIDLKYGRLFLNKFQCRVRENFKVANVKVLLNDKIIKAEMSQSDDYVNISFGTINMNHGDKLRIVMN